MERELHKMGLKNGLRATQLGGGKPPIYRYNE